MLPGEYLGTIEHVFDGDAFQIQFPQNVYVELIQASCTGAWSFARQPEQPMFPVPAGRLQEIPYDARMEFWANGTGTLSLAIYGSAAPPGTPVTTLQLRLLEDATPRLLENGTYRLLESSS